MSATDSPSPLADAPDPQPRGRRGETVPLPEAAMVLASKAMMLGARLTIAAFGWPRAQRLAEARLAALHELASLAALAGVDFPVTDAAVAARASSGEPMSAQALLGLGAQLRGFAERIAPVVPAIAPTRENRGDGNGTDVDALTGVHLRLMDSARRRVAPAAASHGH